MCSHLLVERQPHAADLEAAVHERDVRRCGLVQPSSEGQLGAEPVPHGAWDEQSTDGKVHGVAVHHVRPGAERLDEVRQARRQRRRAVHSSAMVEQPRGGEVGGRELANIAYGAAQAFTMLGQSDEKLFTALARAAELRMSEFKAQEIANTAWAFAKLDQLDEALFAALAREAELRMS